MDHHRSPHRALLVGALLLVSATGCGREAPLAPLGAPDGVSTGASGGPARTASDEAHGLATILPASFLTNVPLQVPLTIVLDRAYPPGHGVTVRLHEWTPTGRVVPAAIEWREGHSQIRLEPVAPLKPYHFYAVVIAPVEADALGRPAPWPQCEMTAPAPGRAGDAPGLAPEFRAALAEARHSAVPRYPDCSADRGLPTLVFRFMTGPR